MNFKLLLLPLSLLIVLLAGCTQFQLLDATVPTSSYFRTNDLAYGTQPRQKLDVYRPKHAPPNAKVVVFFYGGSWRGGKKADYRFVAQALTSRGFVTVLPDYRVYPEVTFPGFVEDGASAIRWVHDHISKFGGDPNQIYLMGHSAGSHIAALLTVDAHYLQAVGMDRNQIRAFAGLSGPYDFIPNPADRAPLNLITNSSTRLIEPINFVDGHEPPMLLIQGLRDTIVSPINSSNLTARIREKGGQVEYITYAKRGHVTIALALAWPFRWLAPALNDVTTYFDQH